MNHATRGRGAHTGGRGDRGPRRRRVLPRRPRRRPGAPTTAWSCGARTATGTTGTASS